MSARDAEILKANPAGALARTFRPQFMDSLNFLVQSEAAFSLVARLGELDAVEFVDLNAGQASFARIHVKEVQKSVELERQLAFLGEQVNLFRTEETTVQSAVARANVKGTWILPPAQADGNSLPLPSDAAGAVGAAPSGSLGLVPDLVTDPERFDGSRPGGLADAGSSDGTSGPRETGGRGAFGDPAGQPAADLRPPTTGSRLRELDTKLSDVVRGIKEANGNFTSFMGQYYRASEILFVLRRCGKFLLSRVGPGEPLGIADDRFHDDDTGITGAGMQDSLMAHDAADSEQQLLGGTSMPSQIVGTITRERFAQLSDVVHAASRGNVFISSTAGQSEDALYVYDAETGEMSDRVVFVMVFHGERLGMKMSRICTAFEAELYTLPEDAVGRAELQVRLEQNLARLTAVIRASRASRQRLFTEVYHNIDAWRTQVRREKQVFHTLNMFQEDESRRTLIGRGWCPRLYTEMVVAESKTAGTRAGAQFTTVVTVVDADDTPPSFFMMNRFNKIFHLLVNSYGTPRYRELTPMPLTAVFFPFLFGIMFGDVGHGTLLTLSALALIVHVHLTGPKPGRDELLQGLFDGRYMLLMMGMWATFMGSLYNETFSLPLGIFPSRLEYVGDATTATLRQGAFPYPWGVDPVWAAADNKLNFVNPLKIKLSVLVAIFQISLGILASAVNFINAKHFDDLVTLFLPSLCFFWSIFGYLGVLIVVKWLKPYTPSDAQTAPTLIAVLLDMFLSPGNLSGGVLYPGQGPVQMVLLVVAFVSVPWLLLARPVVVLTNMLRKPGYVDPHTGSPVAFGEFAVHQLIHTIEFALGCVSHTASYLRLWALSLAHSALAEVFWHMLFQQIFASPPASGVHIPLLAVAIFVGFFVWAVVTIVVLMGMEAMSASLHALRLIWVEQNSKFFLGDGRPFLPLTLGTS